MGVSLNIKIDPALRALAAEDPEAPVNAVLEAWGKDANSLLELEKFKVTQRTMERAYDTGALASSVTGRAYQGAKSGTLVSVWFNPSQQYAAWGRYYAPYQEGPPIGASTYTNEPRHMLYDSYTYDRSSIQQWAVESAGEGAQDWLGTIVAEAYH